MRPCPPDPEIKRVVGVEKWKTLTEDERVAECVRFNEDFQKMQSRLPGGNPGVPFGVYRFKTQQSADDQVNFYIMKVARQR